MQHEGKDGAEGMSTEVEVLGIVDSGGEGGIRTPGTAFDRTTV